MFTCKICKRDFRRKDYLEKHKQRKNPCKPIRFETVKPVPTKKQYHGVSKSHQFCIIDSRPIAGNLDKKTILENMGIKHKGNERKKQKEPIYKCEYCNKKYRHKQNKYRHLKNCKVKQNKLEEEEKVKEILKKLEKNNKSIIICNNKELVIKETNNSNINNSDNLNTNTNVINNITNNINITNNTINNNTINNNNINITINPFGKENLDSIKEKDILNILNEMFMSFSSALTKIHYNIPENRNFCLPNKSDRKFVSYFNGKKSLYENSSKFKDKLCNKIMSQLEQWFEIHQKKLLKRKKKMLTKVFDTYYDGKLDKRYYEDIEKFLLSYSSDMKEIMDHTIKQITNNSNTTISN
jgi:hypothetical protein